MQAERITISPMGWFAFRFAFWSPLLFGLIYFENLSPFIFINNLQTDLNVFQVHQWVTNFEISVNMSGSYLIFEHGLKLQIVNECNGLAAFLLFLAAVLSFPTNIKTKVYWIFFSYFVLLVANSIRLDWITYHIIEHPEDFKFAHEVLGRYIIALIPLILFYFFSQSAPLSRPRKTKFQICRN